jgi:surfactin synthase thioesterase subunit
VTVATADRWIKIFEPRPRAELRLFCFPYAGGGASIYRLWPRGLPPEVEVVGVQPPGREARWREEAFRHVAPMADEALRGIDPHLDRPFAFFGHSMGAILAFEVARRLARDGRTPPRHLIVSGRPAPTVAESHPPIHDLPRDEFIDQIRRYSGTPEEVLQNDELMGLLEPLLRADFAVSESYRHEARGQDGQDGQDGPDAVKLTVPLAALGGTDDIDVPVEALDPWSEETSGPFRKHIVEGGHFFVNEARDETLAIVARTLAPHLARA